MDSYNPLEAPDPKEWSDLDEGEKLILIEAFHKRARVRLPNRRVHAVFHSIVENQVADESLPVQEILKRLMAEGLDRHEAIHAIGSVLAGSMYDIVKGKAPEDPNAEYFSELRELTAEKWRKSGQ